ncbi:MAG: DinB family protein [Candidatus Dormibacteraeota bacterium]|nr:DinB family protein [Candidatus Dormibacteraeota bacterium]
MPDGDTRPMSIVMAEEIADANAEFTAFVESCSDEDWRTVCRAEKWRVGVVAHHVAWGHERAADWINAIRNGIPIPGTTQAHNAGNAIKAAQVVGISRVEVVFLARRNAERLVAVLRSLSDEEFKRAVPFGPAGGRPLSIEGLGRSHLDRHLTSMRATLRRS